MKALLALLLLGSLASSAPAQVTRVPKRAVPLNGPVDIDELLRLARVNQAINAHVYLQYSFRQTSREEDLDAEGNVKRTQTKVYRVIPSREGTIRHLLEQDGEEPSARQIKKQHARNEKVRKRWEKIRAKQKKDNEKKRDEAAARQAADAPPTITPAPSPPSRAATAEGSPPPAATAPPTPESSTPPAREAAKPPTSPRAVTRPLLTLEQARPEPAADWPPLPNCSLAEPGSALRPPFPGSVTRPRVGLDRSSEASRKARNNTGDYTVFELLSLTNCEYQGACNLEGRAVHVIAFEPADDFDPQNPVERVVTAMEGSMFIDAADIQVMRLEGTLVAPVKWGAGMVALRAAHVVFEARKVNDEVWLPATSISEFDTRVVFDKERQRFTNYHDDYKKLLVTATEEFMGVAEDTPPGDG